MKHPAQIRYCSSDPEDIIGKALERTAHVFGCLTCTEDDIFLTVVGEKEAIDKLEEVRLVALSDEYGYKGLLAVANNLFLKKYQDDHSLMSLFTKGDKE